MEAAERCIGLAARYANQPRRVAETVSANCLLTQGDEAIIAMTTAYNVVLSRLIAGDKLTPAISDSLMQLVHRGELPFHAVTKSNLAPSRPVIPTHPGQGASPLRMRC
ncbi:MAG: ADP-ribosylglycohydrolase family protein [Nitrosospira sp.]